MKKNKNKKLSPRQKEIILTVSLVVLSAALGIFLGYKVFYYLNY